MHIYPVHQNIKSFVRLFVVAVILFANAGCDIAPQGVKFRPPQSTAPEVCADTGCKVTTSDKEH